MDTPATTRKTPAAEAAEEMTRADYDWHKRHDVLYLADLGVRYHRYREGFFDRAEKLAKTLALFGGAAVFANAATPTITQGLGLLVACASAFSLVYRWQELARRHAELAREYTILEADIHRVGEDDYADHLDDWKARIARIEADEPPAKKRLVRICQNEIAFAHQHPECMTRLNFLQRSFAQII
jgi:hypothetical protein